MIKILFKDENFKNLTYKGGSVGYWSGRRDSNPRLQPWQGCQIEMICNFLQIM